MRQILTLALCGMLCLSLNAQKKIGYETMSDHRAFQSGENLTYVIRYGFVNGGKAYLSVNDAKINGQNVQHLYCKGVTTGIANAVYKVRDIYESYIDTVTQMPVKAIRNVREGRYKRYDEILYDRDSSVVNTTRKGTVEVPEDCLDILSAFYHARNNTFNDNLNVGDTVCYNTYFSSEVWQLVIIYLGKETIKTDFGKIECYKFCPLTEEGRAFKTNKDMQVWISCDENHIPMKIKFDLVVGAFVVELTEYKGLKYPFAEKVTDDD